MAAISLEQALYGSGPSGYAFLARSPGFRESWLPAAQRLCTGFGERPLGIRCPAALFAQILIREGSQTWIAVVQVADQGSDEVGRPGALAFRLLVMTQTDYDDLQGDPFSLAEMYPPDWQVRGDLPTLVRERDLPAPRLVADVQRVFERYRESQPTLLGAAQALVDGGRVVFLRSEPDPDLLKSLWALLPTGIRSSLWPATFAFGNALGFDALALPDAHGPEFAGYVFESRAGDYPEGNYELALQVAAESNDQVALDRLLMRRSAGEFRRLLIVLVGAAAILLAFMALTRTPLTPETEPDVPPPPAKPQIPPPSGFSELTGPERDRLTQALTQLATRLGLTPAAGASANDLLDTLDTHLDGMHPERQIGSLREGGPTKRRLRLLLWKHKVPGYDDPRLSPPELVERLEQKVLKEKGS